MRVWSWLRTNAAGELNICKSDNKFLKFIWKVKSGGQGNNTSGHTYNTMGNDYCYLKNKYYLRPEIKCEFIFQHSQFPSNQVIILLLFKLNMHQKNLLQLVSLFFSQIHGSSCTQSIQFVVYSHLLGIIVCKHEISHSLHCLQFISFVIALIWC